MGDKGTSYFGASIWGTVICPAWGENREIEIKQERGERREGTGLPLKKAGCHAAGFIGKK